jgi:quercetin dioxygenase-like cupin family protein
MLRRAIAVAIALTATPALAEDAAPNYQALLSPLLQSGTDILGAPIQYPAGDAKITTAIVTLAPGVSTGWHVHEVPLYAYILEGELTVDYGDKGTRVYKAGDSVLEAMNWPHNGANLGTVDLKLLAVYMGGGDAANTVKVTVP